MGKQSQLNLPPALVQTVDLRRTNAGATAGQGVVPREASGLTLLVEAAAASGCSEKEVAIALGCPDPPYWSKVKSGEKPAPRIDKLTQAPESVQREYVKRWGRQLGMHVSDEDSMRRALKNLVCAAADAVREIG